MYHILVIEDDKNLSRGIVFALNREENLVEAVYNLRDAKRIYEKNCKDNTNFHLILLDMNLPDGDGLDYCTWIRQQSEVPIIVLTARDLETDEVIALELGADDYITKPFSLSVLKARVNALLRRNQILQNTKEEKIVCNDIILYIEQHKVFKEEAEIELSTTEFRLLKYLMENQGRVLLKEQIMGAVWDADLNFVDENTLPVNIRRLRIKIEEEPSNPQYIKTVHGMGYIWNT